MRYQHSTSRKTAQIRIFPNRAASLTATNTPRLPQPPGHHALAPHIHTLSLFPERTGAHTSWAPPEPIPAQAAPIKEVLKQTELFCVLVQLSCLPLTCLKTKGLGFLPALGYILPKKRSSDNPQAPSLMSFRNMGQDQTFPGGFCIRSCQAGRFPHKVNPLGAVLASLHTHIPLPPGRGAAGRGE